MESVKCNFCKRPIPPNCGVEYERDEGCFQLTKEGTFWLCEWCDNKLLDGDLNWKEVSA